MFLGHPFNVLSTSILTILLARCVGLIPGDIVVTINDAHIYKNHVEQVKEQLERRCIQFPKLRITKHVYEYEDLRELDYDDFELIDYICYPPIKAPMAI